jgi:uncharacterized protein YjbJ (UPF0337 family)
MNKDTLTGQWKQLMGEIKKQWGRLTDNDLTQAEGSYDKLVSVLLPRHVNTRHVRSQSSHFS